MRSEENDRVVQALEVFRIEIPSWGFANTGRRFGKFTQAAAATTIEEKFGDAGYRGSDGLGERRGAEEGKRSPRYKQGGRASSDPGTGGSARPPGTSDPGTSKIRDCVFGSAINGRSARQAFQVLRPAHANEATDSSRRLRECHSLADKRPKL